MSYAEELARAMWQNDFVVGSPLSNAQLAAAQQWLDAIAATGCEVVRRCAVADSPATKALDLDAMERMSRKKLESPCGCSDYSSYDMSPGCALDVLALISRVRGLEARIMAQAAAPATPEQIPSGEAMHEQPTVAVPRHLLTKLMAVMRECGWNNSAAADHETDNEIILALAAQEVHDEFSVLIGETTLMSPNRQSEEWTADSILELVNEAGPVMPAEPCDAVLVAAFDAMRRYDRDRPMIAAADAYDAIRGALAKEQGR